MSIRKYAGIGLGLVLSLVVVASVMANTIGPNSISNKGPGWNSEIWVDNTKDTTTFSIKLCSSSDSTLKFDLMHHWPAFPTTGTAVKTLTCSTSSSYRHAYWYNVDTADYSIEYTRQGNSATVSLTYRIIY